MKKNKFLFEYELDINIKNISNTLIIYILFYNLNKKQLKK
jgi:hypothetical protein